MGGGGGLGAIFRSDSHRFPIKRGHCVDDRTCVVARISLNNHFLKIAQTLRGNILL